VSTQHRDKHYEKVSRPPLGNNDSSAAAADATASSSAIDVELRGCLEVWYSNEPHHSIAQIDDHVMLASATRAAQTAQKQVEDASSGLPPVTMSQVMRYMGFMQ
jgi:hypothetical protein